jgi:Spy/CpxP family protein refolding chaperone
MKALRIAALGVALVIGSATVASAQQQAGAPGRGAGRPNPLMVGIDSTLTAEQKTKIADINAKYQPEMAAVRELMATDREGAMKKRAEITAKQNPEIRAVLTKEQQATFDKNVEELAKRMANGGGQRPPTE